MSKRVMSSRLTLAMVAGLAGVTALQAAPPERPNFIIVFTDDQGYGDLGVQGSPHIRTPHIDRLAREGIRFTDFYAQPFCGPSRAALLTGTYPARNSLMFNHIPRARTGIHPDEITIAELLKTRGYATQIIGKWHLGDAKEFLPTRNGFDAWYGLPYSNDMWPFHPKIQPTPDEPELRTRIRRRAESTGYDGQGQIYPLDWFPDLPLYENEEVIALNPDQSRLTSDYTDRALQFIEANTDRPFFLYLAHSMPHVPLFPGKEFAGRSLRGRYGNVIEEIDYHVGRIRAKLEELELDSRTLVIFTSDNGPWMQYGIDAGSAGRLRGSKGTNFEGGVRVPAIMYWPGQIPAGQVTSEMASTLDLYPTLARLAGAELPTDRTIDGYDIWPVMSEPGAKSPRETFFYYAGGLRYRAEEGPPKNDPRLEAVRQRQWKLHVRMEGEKVRAGALYDLMADVSERKDVASQHPDVVARLVKLAQEFNDELRAHVRPLGRLDPPR